MSHPRLPINYRRRRIISSLIVIAVLVGVFFAVRGVIGVVVKGHPEPVASTEAVPPPEPSSPPLDFAGFDAGNIVSDSVFYDSTTMSEEDISVFLEGANEGCREGRDGIPCITDYVEDSPSFPADDSCFEFVGATDDNASSIIWKAATSCGINPQVLLVMLQKEQGLLTASGLGLNESRYLTAMGYGCPDSAACAPEFFGFANQVYHAARQLRMYANWPGEYAVQPEQTNSVAFHPDPDCGATDVFVENYATAGLYNYTPYQPNQAALSGVQDPCASVGNLNFYAYFNAWFG